MKTAYTMREQIELLRESKELVEVNREADWNLEIPAMDALSGELGGPAFLFNKVKGAPDWRVLTGHFAGTAEHPGRRLSIAMGLDPELTEFEFCRECMDRWLNLIKPIEVTAASTPCKEVKKFGKDVNLLEIPFGYHAIGDSARYTFHSVANFKDPDSNWQGIGQYCTQIYSRNRMTITPYPQSKLLALYTQKYQARNQSMPIAFAVTAPPAIYLSKYSISPPGIHELEIAGAFQGAPLEVVKAETSDMLVPANAEMIIEGEIRPYERLYEGPKLESFGFSVGPRQPMLAVRVNCITRRKDPILAELVPARGVQWGLITVTMRVSYLMIMRHIARQGLDIPVKTLIGEHGDLGSCAYLALKEKPYPGYMSDIYNFLFGNALCGVMMGTLITDSNVDPFDGGEISEAWHTQTNPARDWIQIPDAARITILAPWAEGDDIKGYFRGGQLETPNWIFDASTKEEPPQGVRRTDFETLYPEKLQKWVVDNWSKLGIEEKTLWKDAWLKTEKAY